MSSENYLPRVGISFTPDGEKWSVSLDGIPLDNVRAVNLNSGHDNHVITHDVDNKPIHVSGQSTHKVEIFYENGVILTIPNAALEYGDNERRG